MSLIRQWSHLQDVIGGWTNQCGVSNNMIEFLYR